MRTVRIVLIIVAVVCLGVALSYPIRYRSAQQKNETNMEMLAQMRRQTRQEMGGLPTLPGEVPETRAPDEAPAEQQAEHAPAARETAPAEQPAGEVPVIQETAPAGQPAGEVPVIQETAPARQPAGEAPVIQETAPAGQPAGEAPGADKTVPAVPEEATSGRSEAREDAPEPLPTPAPTPTPEPTLAPNYWDLGPYYTVSATATPRPVKATLGPTLAPTPTPDRSIRTGPLPYPLKEKVALDESRVLLELKSIRAINPDLVGWLTIPGTVIDYPVVQTEDSEFYLTHDFFGEENVNGQIILDPLCDPYTPSYNLVISGHHMKNGDMFAALTDYRSKGFWEKHRFLEFDTLMDRRQYVVFACFYSADYAEDEEGFRYNAILDYKRDVEQWLAEVEANQLYDTGIDRAFGDEFITLTTCNRTRHRNGRFVVVCRKIREGESFE